MNIVYLEAWKEMYEIERRMKFEAYPTIDTNVRCWHPGEIIFSSEASSSFENPGSVCIERSGDVLIGIPWTGVT